MLTQKQKQRRKAALGIKIDAKAIVEACDTYLLVTKQGEEEDSDVIDSVWNTIVSWVEEALYDTRNS